jgi:hypothetical protein
LLGFADNPTYHFRLNTDIDLAAASGLFIPDLAGEFDGAGHILSNLALNQAFTNQLGMFGMVRWTGTVKNVGLTDVRITGHDSVGGLVGSNRGNINNAYATGSVSGTGTVGGLVGDNGGTINNAYATGSVSGTDAVGGLVGDNGGTISNAYSTGNVSGNYNVGGLVGTNFSCVMYCQYYSDGTISNAYATGSVSGYSSVGGLVGDNFYGTINNAFWNTETTGKNTNSGIGYDVDLDTLNNASGKTTAEMMQLATFSNAGWDIANTGGSSAIWRIYEGHTMPLLRSFLTPLTITADNITKTYNGLSDSVLSNPRYSITGATSSGHLFNQGNPYNSAKNVGRYTPTGLYSDQQGYDISYVDSVLTIEPAPLINIKQPKSIRYNLEDQLVPLQVATTFSGNQKPQLFKHDDSEANIVIEKGGIKLPDGIAQ